MSVSTQPDIELTVTPNAGVEVKKFMEAEGVTGELGGLRVSVQPGGCSGFKYSLVIEDKSAEDDFVLDNDGFKVFVDPFSAQYISRRDDRLRDVDAGLGIHVQESEFAPAAAAAEARSPRKLGCRLCSSTRGR